MASCIVKLTSVKRNRGHSGSQQILNNCMIQRLHISTLDELNITILHALCTLFCSSLTTSERMFSKLANAFRSRFATMASTTPNVESQGDVVNANLEALDNPTTKPCIPEPWAQMLERHFDKWNEVAQWSNQTASDQPQACELKHFVNWLNTWILTATHLTQNKMLKDLYAEAVKHPDDFVGAVENFTTMIEAVKRYGWKDPPMERMLQVLTTNNSEVYDIKKLFTALARCQPIDPAIFAQSLNSIEVADSIVCQGQKWKKGVSDDNVEINSNKRKNAFETNMYHASVSSGPTHHNVVNIKLHAKYIVLAGGTMQDMYNRIMTWLETIPQHECGNWIIYLMYHGNDFAFKKTVLTSDTPDFVKANEYMYKLLTEAGPQVFQIIWQGLGNADQWYDKRTLEMVKEHYQKNKALLELVRHSEGHTHWDANDAYSAAARCADDRMHIWGNDDSHCNLTVKQLQFLDFNLFASQFKAIMWNSVDKSHFTNVQGNKVAKLRSLPFMTTMLNLW